MLLQKRKNGIAVFSFFTRAQFRITKALTAATTYTTYTAYTMFFAFFPANISYHDTASAFTSASILVNKNGEAVEIIHVRFKFAFFIFRNACRYAVFALVGYPLGA